MKYSKYSAVIIGSGIAGLYLALKLEEQKKLNDGILIITKSKLNESNSRLAQGGIVGVMEENKMDSVSLHVSDTIRSGCGLTDFDVANFISKNSSCVIKDLLKLGVPFDRIGQNKLSFTLEGAHTLPRILHAGGDATGAKIEQALCEKVLKYKNIDIYEETMAVELLLSKDKSCKGVVTYNTALDSYEAIYTNAVILASGGCGQVYKNTTNPPVATGDGIMLGIGAGAEIDNMEFIQFHPTALDVDKNGNKSLISEAARGEGAKLVNENGEMFMKKYDSRAELAPRDIVTRAVFEENGQIYLDISSIGLEKFKKRFPSISKICEENGIDLKEERIPVAPAAHYCMGGVKSKTNGETTVKNLYAIGEVACTGLHGANRLASNSLLECVVCAWALSDNLSYKNLDAPKSIDENVKRTLDLYEQDCEMKDIDADGLISKLQDIMWKNVGIIRNREKLLDAQMEILQIERIFREKHKCQNRREYELRNLIEVAKTITTSALERKESVGAHFRSDDILAYTANKEIQKDKINDGIFIK